MANQDDADSAWHEAQAQHPELAVAPSQAVRQAREMFPRMPGRDIRETPGGMGVTIRFMSTWPFPLPGEVQQTYVAMALPAYDLEGRYSGGDLGKYIEAQMERNLLGTVLPALQARAVELGRTDSDSQKVAAIRETIHKSMWRSEETRWLIEVIDRILRG